MTMIMILLILMAKYMSESINPVKLSIYLMALSASVFLTMMLLSSKIWFPMIYFMLFMGGILIMFMILSSLMPNEKMMKNQNMSSTMMKIAIMTTGLTAINTMIKFNHVEPEITAKLELGQSTFMIFMILMILTYFLVFMNSMESMKNPMKSQMCRNKSIL